MNDMNDKHRLNGYLGGCTAQSRVKDPVLNGQSPSTTRQEERVQNTRREGDADELDAAE